MGSTFRWLIRSMVNLRFAVGLLTVIALVSVVATVLGGLYGEHVQMRIFQSPPFSALMVVFMFALGLAVASRYPWKKTHIGWITTHAGLIAICCGHMTTCHFERSGHVTLLEGEAASHMEQEDWLLTAEVPARDARLKIRLPAEDLAVDAPIEGREYGLPGGDALVVERYWPTYAARTRIVPDFRGGPISPAIRVEVRAAGRRIAAWLAADDPEESVKGLGDALSIHHRRSEGRLLAIRDGAIVGDLPVERAEGEAPRPLADGFAVRILRRFERFRLVDQQPLDADSGEPNPAVLLEISGADGRKDHRFIFALHGEFPGENPLPLPFELRYAPAGETGLPPASFAVIEAEGQEPAAVLTEPDGTRRKLPLEIGKAVALAWLDAEIAVLDRYPRAAVVREPWCASYAPKRPALRVRVRRAGEAGPAESRWVVWNRSDEPTVAAGSSGPVLLRYGPKRVPLARDPRGHPAFTIELKDFVLQTYEGTESPMSFESFVHVTPQDGRPPFDYHIYMNHPLTFDGHTFFQSSYDPETLRQSTFAVSYDPGWPVVYAGYALTVLGLLFIVYVKPILIRRDAARLAREGLARAALRQGSGQASEGRARGPGPAALAPSPEQESEVVA